MDKKIKIEICGAGCDKFFRTVASFRKAMRNCSAAGTVEEITDGKRIAARGVLNLPAVFVKGKLMIQGEGVSEDKAGELLQKAV